MVTRMHIRRTGDTTSDQYKCMSNTICHNLPLQWYKLNQLRDRLRTKVVKLRVGSWHTVSAIPSKQRCLMWFNVPNPVYTSRIISFFRSFNLNKIGALLLRSWHNAFNVNQYYAFHYKMLCSQDHLIPRHRSSQALNGFNLVGISNFPPCFLVE